MKRIKVITRINESGKVSTEFYEKEGFFKINPLTEAQVFNYVPSNTLYELTRRQERTVMVRNLIDKQSHETKDDIRIYQDTAS